MQTLELRIPPLVLAAIFAAAIVAASVFVPHANVAFPGHQALAVAALVLGLLVAGAGVAEFRRAQTTVNPLAPDRAKSVVSTGVYRFSRNPMYVGVALALLGVAAWRSSLLGYAALPLYCAYLTRFQIMPEERALLARFGPEFSAYMTRVRRWI